MQKVANDVRFALRMLAKRPGSSAIIVAVLALGIGANSAIFSVVNAVLLRPLPYPEPSRLVMLWEHNRQRGNERNVVGPANFMEWRDRSASFEELAAFYSFTLPVAGGTGEPEQVTAQYGTTNLLPMLGVSPMLGRGFEPADVADGSPAVVLLSNGFWQRRFGGDPGVLGRTIKLNGAPATVVGVLPPDFRFYLKENNLAGARPEVWSPLSFDEGDRVPHGRYACAIGRLAPGVSLDAARSEMSGLSSELAQRWPDFDANWGVTLVPLPDQMVGEVRRPLWVLFGAVGFVLLIACANVANLSLARASARRNEMAVRAALGAARGRLFRQLITESALLGAIGGGAGLLLASWGVDLLLALSPKNMIGVEHVDLDGRVAAFTTAATLLTCVAFGLLPALEASRVDLNEAIREGGTRSATERRGRRTRDLFVVVQVALALVLLVGSGLLVKSLGRLQSVDPGFASDRLLTAKVKLPAAVYEDEAKSLPFFRDALERVRAIPGVRSASAINFLPFDGPGSATSLTIEGAPPTAPGEKLTTEVRVVDPAYFATMGVPLLSGRTFTEQETRESSGVVVVSREFANRYFPGEDPIGKRVTISMKAENPPSTVVGVVGDVRLQGFDADVRPTAYWPPAELPYTFATLVVRTEGDPRGAVADVREAVGSIDPEVPISSVRTMDERLADSVERSRFDALLLTIFAGVALLIAVVGVYGVVSYTVSRRTQEIGVRMALGATRGGVLRMVLRRGLLLALAGVAVGLVVALGLTRLMTGLLFEVSATDPATYAVVAAALATTALLACLLPARRAASVEPVSALRHE